jgi:hypothetical protein
MNPAELLNVIIELDAFLTQCRPIANAIIDSECVVIELSDNGAL